MKRVVTLVNRRDEALRDLAYWRSRPIHERIAEVERLRLDWLSLRAPHEIDAPMVKTCRIVKRNKPAG